MSCCQGRRPVFQELITMPSAQEAQKKVEEAATGAQKIGMAVAVGSVLAQIFLSKKTRPQTRRKARRTRR
jgi:hypothetical protein